MSAVTRIARIATVAAGSAAVLASTAAIASADPSASAVAERFTPLAGGSHTEYAVNPVLTQDDLLYTNKDFTSVPGVLAHSIDGRNFSYYRLVDGARISMARVNEVCLPTGVCHGFVIDAPSPVF
ncbi:hypothetical protein [Rhodococcus gannanensis]|uniref:Dioxygenase n=1 Tax=Rhodococcus gannanensis TaxID=1960308 RepID=A0ABW4PB93_9NOCA